MEVFLYKMSMLSFAHKFCQTLDGKVVVDACAAPGGKTAHLLERFDLKKLYTLLIKIQNAYCVFLKT